MTTTLRAQNISHPHIKQSYNNPINFSVSSGESLCLLGRNGAGKTTLLKILTGLITPQAGKIICHDAFDYLGHNNGFCEDLSLKDHLSLYGKINHELFHEHSFNLTRPLRFYSRGQKRFIALLIIFSLQKKIWLLDEPFSNMDHDLTHYCAQHMASHLHDGGTIIFTGNRSEDAQLSEKIFSQTYQLNALS